MKPHKHLLSKVALKVEILMEGRLWGWPGGPIHGDRKNPMGVVEQAAGDSDDGEYV